MLAYKYNPNIVENNLPNFQTCTSSGTCSFWNQTSYYEGTPKLIIDNECELREYRQHCPCLLKPDSYKNNNNELSINCPPGVFYSHYMKM